MFFSVTMLILISAAFVDGVVQTLLFAIGLILLFQDIPLKIIREFMRSGKFVYCGKEFEGDVAKEWKTKIIVIHFVLSLVTIGFLVAVKYLQ